MKTTEQMNRELQEKFPFLKLIGEYTGANNKSLIRCNDCGHEWEAVPRSVAASKNGCPKCKAAKNKVDNSLKNFLEKYDSSLYELVEFKNCMEVTVKCKKCGFLRTTNANNIYRYGCPKCGQERTHEARKITQKEFITRANNVHNNKYSYDKVEYINYITPVIITCPKHGDFAQNPGKHLAGQGCPKCAGMNKTTEEIIEEARKVHGDKYDYGKTVYTGIKNPITIICPQHGEFQQLVEVHIKRQCGCPKCNQSHGEREVAKILQSLNIEFKEQVSLKNPYDKDHKFRLDFWIPSLRAIIEYNGKQHYVAVEKFGGELQLIKQQKRDKDLRKTCQKCKIHLLEIPYTEKEIEKSVKEFIERCRVIE